MRKELLFLLENYCKAWNEVEEEQKVNETNEEWCALQRIHNCFGTNYLFNFFLNTFKNTFGLEHTIKQVNDNNNKNYKIK